MLVRSRWKTGESMWRGGMALAMASACMAVPPASAQTSAVMTGSENGELSISGTSASEESGTAAVFDNSLGIPDMRQIAPPAKDGEGVSASLRIFVLLTVLSLAPAVLVMMTSFTRIIIVLALLRQAMGTQQLPPGQVLVGLSLILTMIVMAPTWRNMKTAAVDPYMEGKMSQEVALDRGTKPLRDFMIRQIEAASNEENVYMFVEYSRGPLPEGKELKYSEIGMVELLPGFLLSELKTSFVMGFRLYLPFLVIDMVVAAILISMGMMMLPPVLISLPFKVMLFVLADGWGLVVGSLMSSFA